MPLRRVPNTEDNEKNDHRFDFSVNQGWGQSLKKKQQLVR